MANKANKTFEFTITIAFKLTRTTVEDLVSQVIGKMKITQPELRSQLAKLAAQGYSKRDVIEDWMAEWHDDELNDVMDMTLTNQATTDANIIDDLQSGDAGGTKAQIAAWQNYLAGLGLEFRLAEHVNSLVARRAKSDKDSEAADLKMALDLVKRAGYVVTPKKASK